ncbi:hypothetical protein AALO_G00131480 [Alosa alosa]|uniref:Uncharacterized protein n=1 Tax=Alosa alosa TaxID=278164 RepID=A0AAV6GSP0_9TELE|nr:hypothetical protein AALO_G00131480 [Alosa alosa]
MQPEGPRLNPLKALRKMVDLMSALWSYRTTPWIGVRDAPEKCCKCWPYDFNLHPTKRRDPAFLHSIQDVS